MRAATLLLLAMLSAPCALAQSPSVWFEDGLDFKADTLIFNRDEPAQQNPPSTLSRTRLFVPLAAPASGPAAFQITMRRDCATGQETTSYAEYSADGQEKSPASAAPAGLAAFAFVQDTDLASWRKLCPNTMRSPASAPPPAPRPVAPPPGMKELIDPLFMITAASVAEAIDKAHALAPVVEAARRFQRFGEFELVATSSRPGANTYVVDVRAREQVGKLTRLSFIEPRGGPYSRYTYLVDCEAKTGKRELDAEFSSGGVLERVFGPSAEGPFDRLRYGAALTQLCAWQPGAGMRYSFLWAAFEAAEPKR